MKYLIIPFAMLAAGSVFANQPLRKQVEVIAHIPADSFYVVAENGWDTRPQELSYNVMTETLRPVTQRLIAKSTTGAIEARLEGPAQINSGADAINLNVSINGVDLESTAKVVVPKSQQGNEVFIPIQISAQAGPYAPGSYSGLVNMTFETPLVAR
ncbi:CS1 type fimbrial major subunit [Pseudomonas defluvii]|uniref:CS1 type fimbrial major subunit n=1 Tax=Pseudomonas defluvii TaxID=1876757 RepID=UPI00390656BB